SNVVVSNVTGPHVRSWTRRDDVLQVWLTEGRRQARITLTGWVRNAKPLDHKGGVFELPCIFCQEADASTEIDVRSSPGVRIEPGRLQNLVHTVDPKDAERKSFIVQ